jgi:uncharacterized protein with PQ loop repeat
MKPFYHKEVGPDSLIIATQHGAVHSGLDLDGQEPRAMHKQLLKALMMAVVAAGVIVLVGCEDLVPRDTQSLLAPSFKRSELLGLVAGFGTTFAALPDLLAMLRRRSSAGMNPRMAAIMGIFQILWVYYGLLILSRPVVIWNVVAVLVNFLSVGAYLYFVRKEKSRSNAQSV